MTTINVKKGKHIKEIEMTGHANFADFGKDIVCAAISSIVTTTINAIIRIDDSSIKYTVNDGYIKIEILKNNEIINILIENMLEELKSIQDKYKKNIKINI
ncbi:MAG: ribosomal-processing cysteine protease Prp [Bacilli bacterium]|nr:ribosomal-processing cysteine protease Prp [Bacilli bacterium]